MLSYILTLCVCYISKLRIAKGCQRDNIADSDALLSATVPEPWDVQPGQLQRRERGQTAQVQLHSIQRRPEGMHRWVQSMRNTYKNFYGDFWSFTLTEVLLFDAPEIASNPPLEPTSCTPETYVIINYFVCARFEHDSIRFSIFLNYKSKMISVEDKNDQK